MPSLLILSTAEIFLKSIRMIIYLCLDFFFILPFPYIHGREGAAQNVRNYRYYYRKSVIMSFYK